MSRMMEPIHVSAISFLTQLTFLTRDKGTVDNKETRENEGAEQEHAESSRQGRPGSATTRASRVSPLGV